jgi:hypothetical protein
MSQLKDGINYVEHHNKGAGDVITVDVFVNRYIYGTEDETFWLVRTIAGIEQFVTKEAARTAVLQRPKDFAITHY